MNNSRIDIHENLCNELHDLYVSKNEDYGDSFRKVRNMFPTAILIRLHDKLNRLESLLGKEESERKVKDESIDDTLMDIANYALLELVERHADCEACEEDVEEEEEEIDFESVPAFSIKDAVKRINNGIGNFIRSMRQISGTKHNEIYTYIDPETGKINLFQCVVEDGKVIDWFNRIYNHGDVIDLEVDFDCNEEDEDE